MFVRRLTAKRALFLAFLAHTIYIAASFYPCWATLIPASALLGVTSSFSGIVYGVYLTSLACEYASIESPSNRQMTSLACDYVRIQPPRKDDVETTPHSSPHNNDVETMSLTNVSQAEFDNNSDKVDAKYRSHPSDINDNISGYAINNDEVKDDDKRGEEEALRVDAKLIVSVETQKYFTRFNSMLITFITCGGLLGNITSSLVLGRGESFTTALSPMQHDGYSLRNSTVSAANWTEENGNRRFLPNGFFLHWVS